MPQTVFSWTWLVLFVAISVVRKVDERRAGKRTGLGDNPPLETALMLLWGLAAGVVPWFYVFSRWLAFADLPFAMPLPLSLLGVVLFLAAIWLLHRSHADLGTAWSPAVQPGEGEHLVTAGVFRRVRHPMYAAHLLWGVAQILLLPNLLAGPPALVLMLLLLAVRIPREEKAMLAHFGDAYRDYMARTGRLFPRLG